MRLQPRSRRLSLLSVLVLSVAPALSAESFTPLSPLSSPSISSSSEAYPGENFTVDHLIDGDPRSEYSSNALGTNTTVEFAFDQPVRIGAFRHQDRNDPATIRASELTFFDEAGSELSRLEVRHEDKRGGRTFQAFPNPIVAKKVQWRITQLGAAGHGTVGGAEITFFAAGPRESIPQDDSVDIVQLPIVRKSDSGPRQLVQVELTHPYAEEADAVFRLGDEPPRSLRLTPGANVGAVVADHR